MNGFARRGADNRALMGVELGTLPPGSKESQNPHVGKRYVGHPARQDKLVSFFAVAEGVKDDFSAKDIVPESILPPSDPPLSLS